MSFLRVFLILQVVNTVLLLSPITIYAGYRDDGYARIGYLFFHYTIAPKPEKAKKKKKEAEAEQEKPKKNTIGNLFREKGFSGFMKIVGKVASITSEMVKKILKHTVFHRFWLRIDVGGEDAAKIALNYGYICGAVNSAVSLLLNCARCKNPRIQITPDFRAQESSAAFEMRARILPIFLLNALLGALFQSVKLMKLIKSPKAIHNN